MAKSQTLQTAFSSGVLNPGLAGRTDTSHYYQGMRRGLNVIGVKEGGAKARWGRSHIDDLVNDGRGLPFEFSTEEVYALVFTDLRMYVYKNPETAPELVTNINGSGNDYLVTPWTEAQVLAFDFTQSADTLVIVHPDVKPRTIVRGTTEATWTLAEMPFANVPKFDFNDTDSPTPTSHIVDITFNSFSNGHRYKLELNGFETPEIVYSSSDTDANARRIKDELLLLPPTGFGDTSITVAYQSGTTYRATFSGESADAYEPMTGRNTDNTAASISTTTQQTGVARREDIISATRGWPISVTFFESRLLFWGTKALPQSLIGTVIGGFFPFDFKIGTGLDDQGIFVTVNTDQVNAARAIYAGRHLQLFTSGGEFYAPDRPLTPAPTLPRQSRFGCATGIKPLDVDGATIFVTKEQKTIREYLFLWAEEAYNATSLSVLSSHLLSGINSLAALTSTSDEEDSYVLVTNTDGTAAILNTLRAQDIAAWTEDRTRTGDKLKQVFTVGEAIFYIVERERSGSTVYTLEKADFDTRLDAAKTVTTGLGLTVSGFEHLAGETVQVLVDGAPVDDRAVSTSGQITLDNVPSSSVEAGYFVPPIVETMPLTVDLGSGPLLGEKKRLVDIRIRVLDTLGIIANGQTIPDKAPGSTQLLTPDTPYTGIRQIEDTGWTEEDLTITLTQNQPLPFHVLALKGKLEIGST